MPDHVPKTRRLDVGANVTVSRAPTPLADAEHVVADGDCILSLAIRAGVPAEAVWNHSRNAALRQTRASPAALTRGDRVYVPEPRRKTISGTTNRTHEFYRALSLRLRIRLVDLGKPLRGATCTLSIGGEEQITTVDASGIADFTIAPDHEFAKLSVDIGGREIYYALQIGHLDTHTSERGACQRLKNLDDTEQDPDGPSAPWLKEALLHFQERVGLPATGKLDPKTIETLRSKHGS